MADKCFPFNKTSVWFFEIDWIHLPKIKSIINEKQLSVNSARLAILQWSQIYSVFHPKQTTPYISYTIVIAKFSGNTSIDLVWETYLDYIWSLNEQPPKRGPFIQPLKIEKRGWATSHLKGRRSLFTIVYGNSTFDESFPQKNLIFISNEYIGHFEDYWKNAKNIKFCFEE